MYPWQVYRIEIQTKALPADALDQLRASGQWQGSFSETAFSIRRGRVLEKTDWTWLEGDVIGVAAGSRLIVTAGFRPTRYIFPAIFALLGLLIFGFTADDGKFWLLAAFVMAMNIGMALLITLMGRIGVAWQWQANRKLLLESLGLNEDAIVEM